MCADAYLFSCVILQYARECVNNENLMEPTGGVLNAIHSASVLFFPALTMTTAASSSLSQCCKVQVHATKSIDLSARMPSELIIKELSELEAGKGI